MCGVDLNSGFMVCFQECFRVALLATASYSSREYLAAAAPGSPKSPPILLSCERRKKEGPALRPWDGGELPLPLIELGLFPISYLKLVYVTYRVWKDRGSP
jgi:hypothetical protein